MDARTTAALIDRAMLADGWRRSSPYCFRRPLSPPFELNAQFWIEDDVAATAWVGCPPADRVLDGLGREETAWIRIDADPCAVVERPEDVDGLIEEVRAAAGSIAGCGASVDAFVAAADGEPGAPVFIPAVLAVTGRKAEARRRVAAAGDAPFAERFQAWLDGRVDLEEPEHVEMSGGFLDSLGGALRRMSAPRTPRQTAEPPRLSDLWRAARTVHRMLRDEAPPGFVQPSPEEEARGWFGVDLDPAAGEALERAFDRSPFQGVVEAYIEARLEPDDAPGRMRVVVEGAPVGSVAETTVPITVSGKLARVGHGWSLRVQLP